MSSIWDYYYSKALNSAEGNDITGALESLRKIPKDYELENDLKKLKTLCLIRLGYYKEAYDFSMDLNEFSDYSHKKLKNYEEYFSDFSKEIELQNYGNALKILRKNSGGSVIEHNMEGLLQAIMGNVNASQKSFCKALEMDTNNKTTINLILNVISNDNIKEHNPFVRFFKKMFKKH